MKNLEEIVSHAWEIKNKYSEYLSKKMNGGRNYRRAYLKKKKESSPCTDCGISYPYFMMQADHIDGLLNKKLKTFNMAKNQKELNEEFEKCELVCSNCHAVRTYERQALRYISKNKPEVLEEITDYKNNYLT
jgi:hypothetical protein